MKTNVRYYRLIDANLNRSREGLRVIEDTARFVLGKERRYKEIRALRHELDKLTRTVYPRLVAERDSRRDAGRTIPEGRREDFRAVLAANFRRIEESLRVLEEYAKFISPEAAPALKAMRFKTYILEKQFLAEQN